MHVVATPAVRVLDIVPAAGSAGLPGTLATALRARGIRSLALCATRSVARAWQDVSIETLVVPFDDEPSWDAIAA